MSKIYRTQDGLMIVGSEDGDKEEETRGAEEEKEEEELYSEGGYSGSVESNVGKDNKMKKVEGAQDMTKGDAEQQVLNMCVNVCISIY